MTRNKKTVQGNNTLRDLYISQAEDFYPNLRNLFKFGS